jgi:hypothetical protein
MGGRVSES